MLYSNCVNCVYLWEWKVVCLVMAFNYFALKASLSSSWATCPFPGGKFLMHTCIIMKAWTCTKRCHHLYILQTYRNIIQDSDWDAQITRCWMLTCTVTNALTSAIREVLNFLRVPLKVILLAFSGRLFGEKWLLLCCLPKMSLTRLRDWPTPEGAPADLLEQHDYFNTLNTLRILDLLDFDWVILFTFGHIAFSPPLLCAQTGWHTWRMLFWLRSIPFGINYYISLETSK